MFSDNGDIGDIGSGTSTVYTINGVATSVFIADMGKGIANISASMIGSINTHHDSSNDNSSS